MSEGKTRKDPLRATYDMATQRLREAHPEEFTKLRKAAAEELGVEWEPRLTAEQKAEQQFEELLERYPHLRERLDEDGSDDD